MPLRDAAEAAYHANVNDGVANARTTLGDRLAPYDVAGLTHVAVTSSPRTIVYVFTDGELHVAARSSPDGWSVVLVEERGGWTAVTGDIDSLSHLGQLLLAKGRR